MFTTAELRAAADLYILRKALHWLEGQLSLPPTLLKQVDALNAEKCGLSGKFVCQVLV